MIDEAKKLEPWVVFVQNQAAYFNAATVREEGHLRVADEINAAFLKTDDAIIGPEIEKAVNVFIRDGAWPQKMGERMYHHLSLRASAAHVALLTVVFAKLDEEDPLMAVIRPQLRFIDNPKLLAPAIRAAMPDDLDDNERMAHWLFIDNWKKCGQRYLDALADHFLKEKNDGRPGGTSSAWPQRSPPFRTDPDGPVL